MREAAQHFLELPWIDAVRLHHRARDGIAKQLGEGRLGESLVQNADMELPPHDQTRDPCCISRFSWPAAKTS
jgi:hypothetical protein